LIISKTTTSGCCGNSNGTTIMYLEKPIMKAHVQAFLNAGYLAPSRYIDQGFFYVRRNGLVANCTFGSNKVTVRCNAAQRDEKLKQFQDTLEETMLLI